MKEELNDVIIPTGEDGLSVLQNPEDIELLIPNGLSRNLRKEIKESKNIGRQEIRFLVDSYYQIQDKRKRTENQIRAIRQESDNAEQSFCDILEWQLTVQKIQEKGIADALKCVCETSEVGRWLTSIKGIGPVLAAGLMSYYDVTGINYATHFISYGGLNDNNRPWLGAEASKKIVNEVLGDRKEITEDDLETLSLKTKWSYDYLNKSCSKFDDDGNVKSRSKTDLIKAISKIPYNKELKTLLWKVSQSFVKVSGNKDSLYGRLYRERKILETELNEKGLYKDQAARILATKNIGKTTDAYAAYSKGKLPKAHIQRRAERWTTKIFVVHLFEEMYRVEHDGKAPEPFYVFTKLGHKDYIEPEQEFTR